MSTIYLYENKEGVRATLFNTLSEEDWELIIKNYDFLEENIIRPILGSKEKKVEVNNRLGEFSNFILNTNQYIIRKYPTIYTCEKVGSLYDEIRRVPPNIPDRYKNIFSVSLDLLEENDYYLVNFAEKPELQKTILSMGLQKYLRAYHGTLLCLILINYEDRWCMPFSPSIMLLMKRYLDDLDAFVATLQVGLEPELSYLRKPAIPP